MSTRLQVHIGRRHLSQTGAGYSSESSSKPITRYAHNNLFRQGSTREWAGSFLSISQWSLDTIENSVVPVSRRRSSTISTIVRIILY